MGSTGIVQVNVVHGIHLVSTKTKMCTRVLCTFRLYSPTRVAFLNPHQLAKTSVSMTCFGLCLWQYEFRVTCNEENAGSPRACGARSSSAFRCKFVGRQSFQF